MLSNWDTQKKRIDEYPGNKLAPNKEYNVKFLFRDSGRNAAMSWTLLTNAVISSIAPWSAFDRSIDIGHLVEHSTWMRKYPRSIRE